MTAQNEDPGAGVGEGHDKPRRVPAAAAAVPPKPDDLPPSPPWLCIHCGMAVDEPLDACWNCGAARGD